MTNEVFLRRVEAILKVLHDKQRVIDTVQRVKATLDNYILKGNKTRTTFASVNQPVAKKH